MVVMLAVGCSTSRKDAPLKAFTEDQQKKVVDKSVSVQAEPLFWAALYEPTRDDLEGLRAAWNEHSRAFPESRAIQEIEKVLAAPGERPLLVALFTSDTDKADLSSKSLGWSVSPVPQQIKDWITRTSRCGRFPREEHLGSVLPAQAHIAGMADAGPWSWRYPRQSRATRVR